MRIIVCAGLLSLLLLSAGGTALADLPTQERGALIALYNSTGGGGWNSNSGWKTPPLHTDGFALPGTEGTWFGVTVTAGHVSQIDLYGNHLAGPIPAEIGLLPALTTLRLSANNLTGPIPPEVGGLASLETLSLYSNHLVGPLPSALGQLAALKSLTLDDNDLVGPLPAELGNLAALETLFLSGNSFPGPLPPFLGSMGQLQDLELMNCGFTGLIPAAWSGLHELTDLRLSNNALGGDVLPSVLQFTKLKNLYLYQCQVTGVIPPGLGALSQLRSLQLSHNQLTGSIPPELGGLPALTGLYLDFNQLSGPIPPELGNLSKLTTLKLDNNSLTGVIPPAIGGLTALKLLELSSNQMDGPLPAELGQLAALEQLALAFNGFRGPIPDGIGALASLKMLELSGNSLQGAIPATIGNLAMLTQLRLAGNRLQGEVPDTLLNLAALLATGLDLGYNALTASDPDVLAFIHAHAAGLEFEATQTVAPAELGFACTGSGVLLDWDPIHFTSHDGGYRVFRLENGLYKYMGRTANKTVTSFTVQDISPGVPYTFVMDTFTEPHPENQNTVYSLRSEPLDVFCGTFTTAETRYFPRQTYVSGAWTEGYGFYNPGADDAGVRFTRYSGAGQAVNTAGPLAWYAGEQGAYQVEGVFGLTANASGWVKAESTRTGLLGYFLTQHFVGRGLAGLDGAATFSAGLTDGYFPRTRILNGQSTELTLANPGGTAVSVVLTGLDGIGVHSAAAVAIPARGCQKIDPGLFFGEDFDGAVHVEASGPVIGNALIKDGDASIASLNLMPGADAASHLYAAHIVRFPGLYYSELNLVNPNETLVQAQVTFYLADGSQPRLDTSFDIPAGQVRVVTDEDLGLPADENTEGWLSITCKGGPLLGCLTFGNPADNHYMSSLPLQSAGSSDISFVQVVNGEVGGVAYFTGLAVVNPNATPVDVRISVHHPSGQRLGNLVTRTLAPHEKYVRLLQQIEGIGTLPDQSSGYLRVTSQGGDVCSFLLFGDEALNFLSAVPAQ